MTGNFKSWAEVKAQKADEISAADFAEARAVVVAEVAAYRLAEIRKDQHRTQTQIAARMGIGQRRVSAIESAELAKAEVGTIAAYVHALGGSLRLVADFGDRTVLIQDDVGGLKAHC